LAFAVLAWTLIKKTHLYIVYEEIYRPNSFHIKPVQ
jgi:hypothetical protein